MDEQLFLSDVKDNVKCKIVDVLIKDVKLLRRIYDFGFINGQTVIVIKKSSLKETFLININDTVLTIRNSIASSIVVKYE